MMKKELLESWSFFLQQLKIEKEYSCAYLFETLDTIYIKFLLNESKGTFQRIR